MSANAKNALLSGDPDLAVALALEAVKVKEPPLEATTTLKEIAFAPGTRTVIGDISSGVFHAIFSPDGRFILSGDGKGDVQLWDTRTGEEIRQLGTHVYEDLSETIVVGLAFYPDGQIAISAGGDDVRFWDIYTGKEIRRINLLEPTAAIHTGMSTASFTPDGRRMFWGSWDGSIHLLDLVNGREIFKAQGHSNRVNRVAISFDGRLALSGGDGPSTLSEGQTIKLWDLETGQELREFIVGGEGKKDVYGVAFSPDNHQVAASTLNGIISIWNIDTGLVIQQFRGVRKWVHIVFQSRRKNACRIKFR